MTQDRWRIVENIFQQASDLPARAREGFLDEACAHDPTLRKEVEEMLSHASTGLFFFDSPPPNLTPRPGGALEAGDRILQYEIQSRISVGGMGEVYLAWDTIRLRKIVIKLLRRHLTLDPHAVQRFETEARAASSLHHPNIIEVYESGQTEFGHFIAMEWVDGDTWRKLIDDGPIAIADAVNWGLQAARAIREAHSAGILHRDIKPENFMMRRDGVVKVLDFGLARLADSARPDPETSGSSGTISGTLSGTLSYMSPELLRGETASPGSDIFSLGSLLYEVMTGTHPFAGETPLDVFEAIERRVVIPPGRMRGEITTAIEEVLLRMLDRDVAARPAAGDVVAIFEAS